MLADPRRKDLVQPYTPQHLTPEEMPPDFIAMISLVFGLIGMIAQLKIASWLALFACVSSLANVKKSEADIKQMMCSVSFAFMGLYTNYFRYGVAR